MIYGHGIDDCCSTFAAIPDIFNDAGRKIVAEDDIPGTNTHSVIEPTCIILQYRHMRALRNLKRGINAC